MPWFGFRRGREKKSSGNPLTEDLLAGGVRADAAVAFLASIISDRLRVGGDAALQTFAEWYERLKKINEETARKFAAKVVPMFPQATRQRILDKYGIDDGPDNGNSGKILEPSAPNVVNGDESAVAGSDGENELDGLRRDFAAGGERTFFAAKRLYEKHIDTLCGPRDEALECFWASLKIAMDAGGEKAKDEFIKWCFMTMRDETIEEIKARIGQVKSR
jgi:hypothetical protein